MKFFKLIKNPLTHLSVSLLAVGFLCYFVRVGETQLDKAKRIDFPGTTELALNKSYQRFELKKETAGSHPSLIKNLKNRNLEIIGSVYSDNKKNIQMTIAQSYDSELFLALIKNNQITQIQKINTIDNKKINLEYGSLFINPIKLADIKESSEIL